MGETDSAVEVVVGGSSFGILSMAEEWQSRSPPLEDGEAEAEEAAAAMAAAISDWESIPAAGGTQEAVAVFMAEGKKYWKSEGRKCLKYVSSHRHSKEKSSSHHIQICSNSVFQLPIKEGLIHSIANSTIAVTRSFRLRTLEGEGNSLRGVNHSFYRSSPERERERGRGGGREVELAEGRPFGNSSLPLFLPLSTLERSISFFGT